MASPSRNPATSQSSVPSSDEADIPLFEPNTYGQLTEDRRITEQGSPPPPPLFVEGQPIAEQTPAPPPFHAGDQESQAMKEIHDQFQWLVLMLDQNQNQGWGSAYRDFADVLVLLRAVGGLGMVEKGNNKISHGVFHASMGSYALTVSTFIDLMNLGHSSATWSNKLTMYFRLKSLHSYSQHVGGARFQSPVHNDAWGIVSHWVGDQDKLLPEHWITTRYGNTELQTLVREMVQEIHGSKFYTLSIGFLVC